MNLKWSQNEAKICDLKGQKLKTISSKYDPHENQTL